MLNHTKGDSMKKAKIPYKKPKVKIGKKKNKKYYKPEFKV